MGRIRALIAVTGAVALLGACSGSFTNNTEPASGSWPRAVDAGAPGAPGAARRIAGSRDATAAERTARFAYSVAGSGDRGRTSIGATGAIDFESRALTVRLDVSSLGLGDSVGGTAEVRVVDGVLYVDVGDLGDVAAELPEGKRWLRLDLGPLTDVLGGSDALAEPSNPLGGLEALRGVSSDVEEIGPEVVRGAETTHYRATLDLAAAVADAPAGTRDQVQDLLDGFDGAEIPVDVWLDSQDRVRKYTMQVDGGSLGAGSESSVAVTYELYDFGAPVEVGVPPADEVADIGSMFGELFDGLLDDLSGRSTNSV